LRWRVLQGGFRELQLRADGCARADAGARTAQRVQWADKETNVVNDLPTEAEFSAVRWGDWTLQ